MDELRALETARHLLSEGDQCSGQSCTSDGPSVTPLLVLSTLVPVIGSFFMGWVVSNAGFLYNSSVPCVRLMLLSEKTGSRTSLYFMSSVRLFGSGGIRDNRRSRLVHGTIGGAMVSLVNGKIADVIGRRYTMGISVIFGAAGWLLIASAQYVWCLDLGRLLVGVGIGITLYVFALCCEFSMVYFLGTVVSWRMSALIGVAPCILQMIGLFVIPESPRWLAKVGHDVQFEGTLRRLRGKNADISQEAADIWEYMVSFEQKPQSHITDLFQLRYAHSIIIAVGLVTFMQLGATTAIANYASSIFESAGLSGNIGIVSIAIIQIPVTGLCVVLMDKAGRRPLLMVSSTGMCMSCFLVGLAFCFQNQENLEVATPVMVFVGLMAYTVFYSIGIAVPWVLMSEVFPINVKGAGGSLVTLVNWSSAWVSTYTFNFMFEWSPSGTFYIFATICALAVAFETALVPETKGRVLEELHASLVNFLSIASLQSDLIQIECVY
ncbi:hypothetical protein MLD38_017855 [Melastoma candidum]|uniref:Uncharacterized protein n=1 Tax=Melastoma candidum TaxID=119954 RepID=A0ACB9QS16_9MYRT|nr:hypothetical protein MLD38_017855 [Melastoma candidum]